MEGVHPSPSWNSWITCSTGSGAGGRRRTWSCCCSAAVKCSTGWARSCCSARGWANAPTCSRSSSRSLPCEWGAAGGLQGGPCRARPAPDSVPHQLQAEPGHALLLRHRHRPQQRCRQPPAPHLGGEGWAAPTPCAPTSSLPFSTPLALSWVTPDQPWVLPDTSQEPWGAGAHTWLFLDPSWVLSDFTLCVLGTPQELPSPSVPPELLWVLLDCSWMLPPHSPVLPDHPWVLPDTAQLLPGSLGCSCPQLSPPRPLLELSLTPLWVILEPSRSSHPHLSASRTPLGAPKPPLGLSGHPQMLPDPFLGVPRTSSMLLPSPLVLPGPAGCYLPSPLFCLPEAPREIQESVSEV